MKKETKIAICLGIVFGIVKILLPTLAMIWAEFIFPLIALIIYGTVKIAPFGIFLAVIKGNGKLALGWCIAALICYIIGNLLV